jgi:prolactin regulatory element-binding protein
MSSENSVPEIHSSTGAFVPVDGIIDHENTGTINNTSSAPIKANTDITETEIEFKSSFIYKGKRVIYYTDEMLEEAYSKNPDYIMLIPQPFFMSGNPSPNPHVIYSPPPMPYYGQPIHYIHPQPRYPPVPYFQQQHFHRIENEHMAYPKVEDVKSEDDAHADAHVGGELSYDAKADDVKVDDVKVEDVKVDDVKAEDVKVDDVQAEDDKTEVAKTEGIKAEVAKTEGIKAEVAKTEGIKAEVAKTEGIKAEVAKTEGIKAEVAKAGGAKAEKPIINLNSIVPSKERSNVVQKTRPYLKSSDNKKSDNPYGLNAEKIEEIRAGAKNYCDLIVEICRKRIDETSEEKDVICIERELRNDERAMLRTGLWHYGPFSRSREWEDRNLSVYEKNNIELGFIQAQKIMIKEGWKLLDISNPEIGRNYKIILSRPNVDVWGEEIFIWHGFNKLPTK